MSNIANEIQNLFTGTREKLGSKIPNEYSEISFDRYIDLSVKSNLGPFFTISNPNLICDLSYQRKF